uniref:Uncharacterized protein n=1 Tax=Glossina austeni TaxID=7395 RepID=A0A1A9UIB9_GLOAU
MPPPPPPPPLLLLLCGTPPLPPPPPLLAVAATLLLPVPPIVLLELLECRNDFGLKINVKRNVGLQNNAKCEELVIGNIYANPIDVGISNFLNCDQSIVHEDSREFNLETVHILNIFISHPMEFCIFLLSALTFVTIGYLNVKMTRHISEQLALPSIPC